MALEYSKEVKKNFTNPKNMGEIKNADGIGKVGNPTCGDVMHMYIKVDKDKKGKEILKDIKFKTFGCLPPHEKVVTNLGWKEINSLSKKDIVFNSKGEKVGINKFYKANFNGELYYITPFVSSFNSFYVTPTHPIFCIKRKFLKSSRKSSTACEWKRISEKELIKTHPYYVEAELVEKGDYLIFPKLKKESKEDNFFTYDLMKLMGYYVSEGYITAKGNCLNFAFNKNEERYINEVRRLIKKIIGKEGNFRIRNNVCEVYVCSAKWCRFFLEHAYKIAKTKKLSDKIMNLPFEKQWKMVESIINGDGNIYKRRKIDSPTYRIDTVSEELAIQIQKILAKGNIFSSIKKFKRPETIIEGRQVKSHTIFNISFKLKKNHNFIKENKDYFMIPIKKIEKIPFKGEVHNIEVCKKDNSYLVKGFVVHNCAAAIATSSMITQLAKGKSLEEAEKITRNDVAESLHGLPPVKMHCSNLASDALRKAIEDYRKKSTKSPKTIKKESKKSGK